IADRLGVARSVISELLARLGPAPVQQILPTAEDPTAEPTEDPTEQPGDGSSDGSSEQPMPEPVPAGPTGAVPVAFAGSARIATGAHACRYAGAMLLYPYLHRVGAEAIFATVTGGPARRYDDVSVLTT